MWKKKLQLIGWCALGLGAIVLLVAAMHKKEKKTCAEIRIEIEGAQDHVFLDEKEVLATLKNNGAETGIAMNEIPLRKLEAQLELNPWVKDAELFFDNKQALQVKIVEREPVARIFTLGGNSFYIDSSGMRLPLSDKLSARLPVFTSFPSDKIKLSTPDSLVLEDVKHIARYISLDSFWMQQISQVDITPKRTYEMIPVVGNQVIVLGTAEDLDKKLDRLYSFYKQVWAKTGVDKYETIDVQYEGQVVAVKKGTGKQYMDSVRAMQQLNSFAAMDSLMRDTAMQTGGVVARPQQDTAQRRPAAAATQPKPAATSGTNRPANVAPQHNRPKPVSNTRTPRAVMPKKR